MPIHIPGYHGKPYRPSNGDEGERFEAAYCDRCKRQPDEFDSYHDECHILADAFMFEIGEEGYPAEWVWAQGWPLCTAYEPRDGERPAPVSLDGPPS